ncbi:MAG: PHP domain-containing protein [Selenomonadaceae bacterium]|nr:PHP domain-containing protein [Selenomonadaceae bacterium]
MGRKCIMDDAEAEAAIDLHMHSIASDGTDSIQELLENVRSGGIRTFSLTDHDTIDGVMEMESIVPKDMTFIRGIEFSCITAAGKCHILGYGYDKN